MFGLLSLMVLLPLVLLFMSGCASQAVQAPRADLFGQMLKPDMVMPAPAPLPARPAAQHMVAQGGDLFVFDAAGARQLLARDQVAEYNTELAGVCAMGFNEIAGAYGVMLDQAQHQEQAYNLVGEKWAAAETQLQREGVIQEAESWVTRALLFIAVGLAL